MTKTRKRRGKDAKPYTRKDRCAPGRDGDKLNFTCYSPDALHGIKELWNARHPDKLISSNDSEVIWRDLKKYIGSACRRESCWIRQNFISSGLDPELLNYTFAPPRPGEWDKNPNTWLSSVDIGAIMKQFEHAYPSFEFLGPSPIDYDTRKSRGQCVWDELCKFDLKEQTDNGKTKIGIVFNLDQHYKGGSHWVAMFIDCKKKSIYYFDSYGDKMPRQIMKLAKLIQQQSIRVSEKYDIHVTKKRHQYGDSECGMYSLYFIIHMLKGNSVSFFDRKLIPDIRMEKLRKKLFN
jgi:hypothetical protein